MAEIGREAMVKLAYEREIFSEMVVPTQLSPIALEPLFTSARQTSKVLAMEEGSLNLGWSAEIAARLLESLGPGVEFGRVAARNMPIPAAAKLEEIVLPQVDDIYSSALTLAQR
jgi:pyruvate/2-oxoglutarate/acetoin dehydrogenase E1 component